MKTGKTFIDTVVLILYEYSMYYVMKILTKLKKMNENVEKRSKILLWKDRTVLNGPGVPLLHVAT